MRDPIYPACPVCHKRIRKGTPIEMWSTGKVVGPGPDGKGFEVETHLAVVTCMRHEGSEVAEEMKRHSPDNPRPFSGHALITGCAQLCPQAGSVVS